MKDFLACALLLVCAASASGATRTFTYEVTLPGSVEPQLVRVQEQGEARVVVESVPQEYTKSVTSVPYEKWLGLVKKGQLPVHDRVICGPEDCQYISLGLVQNSKTLLLKLAPGQAEVETRVSYSVTEHFLEKVPTGVHELGFTAPSSKTQQTVAIRVLNVGDSVVLGQQGTQQGAVRLLKIE